MVCDGFIQPLNLECVFVNFLAGDWIIFGILAVLFIIGLAGTFRMSNAITGASIFLFAILFYDQLPWLIYLSTIIGGIVIGVLVAVAIKR